MSLETTVRTSEIQISEEEQRNVEAVINAFLDAWNDSSGPPLIAEFLDAVDERLHPLITVELVKIDLENRWQRGLKRVIEDYLTEFPWLSEHVSAQLVIEEYHVRKLAGDTVTSQDFVNRFPKLADPIRQLMAVDPLLDTRKSQEDGSQAELDLKPGDSVDDIDLSIKLADVAFAHVFLALQRSNQRIVGVKISANKGDEPQTMAQLDHNNIVRVYDQRAIVGTGLRLLYMQYAAGGTLASALEYLQSVPHEQWDGRNYLKAVDHQLNERAEMIPAESVTRQKIAQMSWPEVVCWVSGQLSRALGYAHKQGVLHRDIKPANVLLTAEGVPKLADFNISFSKNVEGSSAVAYFGGSLAYMSPEQLEAISPRHERTADSLTERSDLYSLGVLTWELFTGQLPFPVDLDSTGQRPLLKKMIQRRTDEFSLDGSVIGKNSLGLDHVLFRVLAPEDCDRFPTGLALAQELDLCLQPAARQLMHPSQDGWSAIARRFPLSTVTLLTLIPNLIAAVFNFLYNQHQIVNRIPEAEPMFMRIQAIINSVAFPVGILSASWLAGSVAKATQSALNTNLTPQEFAEQRRRCLNLGHVAAAVGLILWLIAAPVYPISLHVIMGSVPVEIYVHFVASLTICGLIAAAFPFFAVTMVSVHCFYPRLITWETMSSEDRLSLQRLMRQSWLYLMLAASVPMVAIVILVIAEPDFRAALVILAAGGVLGYVLAVALFRHVQADLVTLLRAIWPREDHSS